MTRVDHQARSKNRLNGGGHGQCIALAVDDADVAGAVLFLLGHGGVRQCARLGLAWLRYFHAGLANQRAALLEVIGPEQIAPVTPGGLDKVRVGHVLAAVGKSQSGGLGEVVQPIG